jgi:hypothetical protein
MLRDVALPVSFPAPARGRHVIADANNMGEVFNFKAIGCSFVLWLGCSCRHHGRLIYPK